MEPRIGYEIKRLQQLLRASMDSALEDLDLGTSQYAALSALEANPKASSAELARQCFVTPQSMNEIVQKLENAGLLERQPHPEHGRILVSAMTRAGKKLLAQAHERVESVQERMLSGLDGRERRDLLEALQRCSGNLEQE